MDTFSVALKVAKTGLIAYEHPEKNRVSIARPASVSGTSFRGWQGDEVSAVGEALIKINAPVGQLKEVGEGQDIKYNVEIKVGVASAPGPEWISENFSSLDEAIDAAIECYFGDRIDFNNPSLEYWYGDQEQ